MTQRSVGASAVVSLALVAACAAPPPDSELLAEPIVLTKHAPDVNFSSFQTFFVRPEVREVTDDGASATLDSATAKPFLDAVTKNMTARGYREADAPSAADLEIEMLYVQTVSNSVWCYSWYDPVYWGYPAYGYYPYYGGCDGTVWRSGLLATLMVDATGAKAQPNGRAVTIAGDGGTPPGTTGAVPQLPGIWFSGVYGVELTSPGAVDGINQSFAQSPYISAKSSGGSQ